MLGCTSCLIYWHHDVILTHHWGGAQWCALPQLCKKGFHVPLQEDLFPALMAKTQMEGPFFEPPLDGNRKQSRRKRQQRSAIFGRSYAPTACIALCVPPEPVWSCRREGRGRECAFPKQTMYWKAGMGASNTSPLLWPDSPSHGRKALGKSYLASALS